MSNTPPELLAGFPRLVAQKIDAAIPELAECDWHPGRFDLAEIRDFGARTPSVRVSLITVGPGAEQGGPTWYHELVMAAFVLTQDAPGLPRDVMAMALVQRLLQLIPTTNWGSDHVGQARQVSAESLYSKGTRERGIGLWGISWRQHMRLVTDTPLDPNFLEVICSTGLNAPAFDPFEVSRIEGDAA